MWEWFCSESEAAEKAERYTRLRSKTIPSFFLIPFPFFERCGASRRAKGANGSKERIARDGSRRLGRKSTGLSIGKDERSSRGASLFEILSIGTGMKKYRRAIAAGTHQEK